MKDNIKYMFKNWMNWDGKSLFFFFLRVPALVLQPMVTAYIPKAMIDGIEKGVTIEKLILIVALLSLILTFTIWIEPFMKELIKGGARIIRMRYAIMAFRKNLSTEYINIEGLEGRELYKRAEAFYNASQSSSADFIENCNDFLVCIIGVIASSILICKINIFMILLILLTCVGEFILLRFLNKKQQLMHNDNLTLLSKFDYFYKLSKSDVSSKDIKLYGFQDYFISTITKIISDIERIISKYTNQKVAVSGVRAVLNSIRQLIAYVYLIYLIMKDMLIVSDFIFYFGVVTGFSNWIVNLVYSYVRIEQCANDCDIFRKYTESDSKKKEKPDMDFKEINSIEFKDVSFTYPSAEKQTINNLSFKVNKGENIAIVGENGAGKTTAIKLLCGLYYPTSGALYINEQNVENFSKSSYFKLFSVVFQEHFFMPMTIAENISAKKEYDKEKLYSALKKADIFKTIYALPDKEESLMDKTVYKNAVDFSGGEKQKILLAKAIYKDAPIFILDEPTAALDPISENALYLKYNEMTKNKISFFISHRLSSTRFCDRILFLKGGTIVESGTHDELMKLKGEYYRMYQIQSYYYKEMEMDVDGKCKNDF